MSRIVTVAAAQLGPIQRAESRVAVIGRMIALLDKAKAQGADLVVYPELALTTFFPRWHYAQRAEADVWFEREMPGAATRLLFERAKALGLAMSFGLVFVWHLADDRFASVRDLQDQFGEPVLGLVPRIRVSKSKPQNALLHERDARHAYVESFRHLRSALLLSWEAEKGPRILLFTGVAPGEGKTTIAVNLARTLARSGMRVVLVDAEAHADGIHSLLGGEGERGLLDYLRGESAIKEILRTTKVPGLTYITSGTNAEHAEGLFLRPRLSDLMKEIREASDFVILDGPPFLAADDAALLVPHADSVVVVVRPFYTRSRQLRQTLGMLYQRKAREVTLLFNQASTDDFVSKYARNGHQVQKNGAPRPPLKTANPSDGASSPPPTFGSRST